MSAYEYRYEAAAKKASQVIGYDEGKKEAFAEGAKFVIDHLFRMTDECRQEQLAGESAKNMLNKMRLSDVRKFVEYMMDRIERDNEVQTTKGDI
jgi:hypothetical protein